MTLKLPAFLNPRTWVSHRGRSKSGPVPGDLLESLPSPTATNAPSQEPGLPGVPMGKVKALPVALVRRLFSFENRRNTGNALVQAEFSLPEVKPVRNDLFEDDVELVRRRKESRLIHETRPAGAGGPHDPELAVNRLRNRDPASSRLVARE